MNIVYINLNNILQNPGEIIDDLYQIIKNLNKQILIVKNR